MSALQKLSAKWDQTQSSSPALLLPNIVTAVCSGKGTEISLYVEPSSRLRTRGPAISNTNPEWQMEARPRVCASGSSVIDLLPELPVSLLGLLCKIS